MSSARAFDGRIFDLHARLAPRPGAARRLLATMDAVGIDRAVVVAGGLLDLDQLSGQALDGGGVDVSADNDAVAAAAEAAPARLIPFYFGNPYDAGAYRAAAKRFRGLELSPAVHGLGFDDPRVLNLVRTAAALSQPVYAVALGTPGARTADFVALAKDFPDTTFVYGHCGAIGIDVRGVNEIAPHLNIVAETSGAYGALVAHAVRRLGPDRVLFGTESPLQPPGAELAKLAALDLTPDERHQVMWANARRLLAEENS
jgi:predicted TIM-barrel fold metal-dependent hydrolase